jgi:transcriptional regulator with XRE-family HTH domain
MSDQQIGKRLAMIREHRRQSQAELAAAVGVSKSTISHYEHDRARILAPRLAQLAQALHCRVSDLLDADAPLPRASFRGGPRNGTPAGLWQPHLEPD